MLQGDDLVLTVLRSYCSRLVTNGTVDESIFKIAQQKLVLDAAVLESGGDKESATVQNERDVRTMGEILSALLAASAS